MHSLPHRVLQMLGFAALALFIVAFADGLWALLINSNLTTSPTILWSVPAMAVALWLMLQYLDGKWWPRSTSAARQRYLHGNPVSGRILAAALLAGVLSIVALAEYWILLFQLVRMRANVLPDYSKYPLLTVALAIVMGSLVAPLLEEAASRGYFQVILENEFRAPVAVVISSALFCVGALNTGLLLAKASCLLSGRRGVWFNRLLHQFDPPKHFGSHHWRPDSLR